MDDTRELENTVTELLLASGQLTRRLRAVSNKKELTWSQVAIMARLEEAGPMTTADLARAEAVKPQSMGGTLVVMEEEALVERRPHPKDGRQVLIGLTQKGHEARRQVGLAQREWLLSALSSLSQEDRHTLAEAVDLIRRVGDS